MFMNLGGLKIVIPATPYDAKGLLKAAIRDDNPVLYLTPAALLSGDKGPVPEEEYVVPLGQAEVKRSGKDLTIVAIGAMVRQALEAAEKLAGEGIEAEVIDPRSVAPMDWQTILESARKTGRLVVVDEARRTCGAASEIAARVGEDCFGKLKAPIKILAVPDVPIPFSPVLESAVVPDAHQIADAARALSLYPAGK